MAARRRGWDDPWRKYPASVPIPTQAGIATSKQRGDMAATWWSRRLVTLLDSYGLGARMQRGRRYARQGQLVSFDVQPGLVVAQVQGSRRTPYMVTVVAPALSETQWTDIESAMRSRVAFAAQLIAGEVPPELEAVFDSAGVTLLPHRWSDLRAACSCPDAENPCKHIAAVLYVFADRLDDDPWILLSWRGRSRDQLLGHLRAPTPPAGDIAPWWPLTAGAPLPGTPLDVDTVLLADLPVDATAILRRCEPLAVEVRGVPVTDLLDPIYTTLIEAPAPASATR
jgi:hypothetical protein